MKTALGKKLEGPAGTAQEVLYTRDETDDLAWTASVSLWFLDCPDQSLAWRNFILGCVHLRPIEGVKPAILKDPSATHEIILFALDPKDNPDPLNPDTWTRLSPINLVEQVMVPGDALATEILETCARQVVDGYLWAEAPLSGQYEPWRTQLALLAEHARGEHPEKPTRLQ